MQVKSFFIGLAPLALRVSYNSPRFSWVSFHSQKIFLSRTRWCVLTCIFYAFFSLFLWVVIFPLLFCPLTLLFVFLKIFFIIKKKNVSGQKMGGKISSLFYLFVLFFYVKWLEHVFFCFPSSLILLPAHGVLFTVKYHIPVYGRSLASNKQSPWKKKPHFHFFFLFSVLFLALKL